MIRLARFFAVVLLSSITLGVTIPFVSPSRVEADSPGPRLLEATANRIVFDLELPDPVFDQVERDGQWFDRITLPGYTLSGLPGTPELPQLGVSLGVPSDGDVSVRVLDAKSEALPGAYTILPAPTWTVLRDSETGEADPVGGLQASYTVDAGVYASDALVPAEAAALDQLAFVRQQRIAHVMVHPVQVNPARGEVIVYRYLRVEVSFAESQRSALGAPASTSPEDAFDPILRDQLLNYDQARQWRLPRQTDFVAAPEVQPTYPGDTTRPWFKASVRFTGLYELTLADLNGTDLAVLASANPLRLQVWKDGHQLATQFMGDADGSFESNEKLLFYVSVEPDIYSDSDVIWVTLGDSPGPTMPTVDASPSGSVTEISLPAKVRAEADFIFVKDAPSSGTPSSPRWYWLKLNSLFQPSATVQFVASHPIASGYNGLMHIRLAGFTAVSSANPDHRVQVLLNGQALGEVVWDGRATVEQEFEFSPGFLRSGLNQLTVASPGGLPGVGLEEAYLDWFEITYRQAPKSVSDRLEFTTEGSGRREFQIGAFEGQTVVAYDVTNPAAPIRLLNVQTISNPAEAELPVVAPVTDQTRRVYLPLVGPSTSPTTTQYRVRFGLTLDGTRSLLVTTLESTHSIPSLSRDIGSAWRATTNQADYLLVTHRSFMAAAEALAAHRRNQGLSVAVVEIQDIYDEFGAGQLDPRAIRAFVDYAYHYWQQPAPSFVLLLGDGHYDYRMLTSLTMTPNYIPPYYACLDPYVCEVAVDNEFVTVSGNDRLPDLAIGRLPASTVQGATTMVNKITSYETAPPSGSWRQTLAFVSDNYRSASGNPDPAGNFEALTEGVIATIPASYTARRAYYDPYPNDDSGEGYRYRTAQTATSAILNAINAGNLFVNYIGHASINTWAHEAILQATDRGRNDVLQMANGPQLSIVLDMACLSGNFAEPQYTGIEAKMLEWPQGGSVAGWGATGFGVATGHDWLHRGFYRAVFTSGVRAVGQAAVAGKLFLWNNGPHYDDLLDTFGLLGDPATQIALPVSG